MSQHLPPGASLHLNLSLDTLPLEDLVTERVRADEDTEWNAVLGSAESLQRSAEGAARIPRGGRREPLAPPVESSSEVVRERVLTELREPLVRRVLDTTLRALTGGISLEEIEQGIQRGTLGELVGLKLTDPVGNTLEALVRKQAETEGLPPEVVAKIGGAAGLLAGMMIPPGARRAARATVRAAREAQRAAKLTSAETTATLAQSNINLARVEATETTKGVMAAVNALHAERLASARVTVTHGQTIAEAERAGLSLADALRLDVEKFDFRAVQLAVRDYHNAAATHLGDLVTKTLDGDARAAADLWSAFTVAGELSMRDELLGKIGARALESRKILSDAGRAAFTPESLTALAEILKGASGVDPITLARRLDALSKTQQKEFAQAAVRAARQGRPNILYELWINALLSGPQTHVANTLSNASVAAFAIPERLLSAVGAGMDAAVTGQQRAVYFGEAAAMLYGGVAGLRDAIVLSGKALKTGVSGMGPEKAELGGETVRKVMGQGPLGPAVGFWGSVWRLPTRLLTTEDAFFKSINYSMEMHALSYREAMRQGKRGADAAAEMRRIMREKPAEIASRAEQHALINTFNREIEELGMVGEFGGGMLKAVRALPMGRVVAPFLRTPVNLMHYASERTPILNLLSDTLRADLRAGGERRALALGKIGSGASVSAVVAWYAASGLITGGGPRDPQLKRAWRETGWQPYSIRIGDTWYSYNRLDPIGIIIGTIADATEIIGQLPETQAQDLAAAIVLGLSRNMVSKTYLEGISNLIESFDERRTLDLGKVPLRFAPTLMPTLFRTLERTLDPTARETRAHPDAAFREVIEFVNAIRAVTPGFSDTLYPRLNLFAEPVVLPPGWGPDMVSPIYASIVKDDPVKREIARLRLPLSLPPTALSFTGGGARERARVQLEPHAPGDVTPIELTPFEIHRLRTLTGLGGQAPAPERGALADTFKKLPPLREALAQVMGLERAGASRVGERDPRDYATEYRQASDAVRQTVLQSVVVAYKQAAIMQLVTETDALQDAVDQKVREYGRALTTPERVRIPPALRGPGQAASPAEGLTNLLRSLGR